MNKLAFIKKISALLLVVCFILPLSKCSTKMPVAGQVDNQAMEYRYGYKMFLASAKELTNDQSSKIENIATLLYIFTLFFIPVISLLLKPLHQSVLILIGSIPSAFFLTVEFIVHIPLIGFWLASLCWLTLIGISLLTLWPHLPKLQHANKHT